MCVEKSIPLYNWNVVVFDHLVPTRAGHGVTARTETETLRPVRACPSGGSPPVKTGKSLPREGFPAFNDYPR